MELVVAIGSQPVAVWNVEDHVMAQRIDSAEHKHTEIDMDSPPHGQKRKQSGPLLWTRTKMHVKALLLMC